MSVTLKTGNKLLCLMSYLCGMAGVVCAGPLTGRNALGRRGGGVFCRILQPFHHLPLDGGADRLGGGGPQAVRRLAQHVLAARVPGGGGAQLGRFHHVGGGVGQGFRRRQQAFLNGEGDVSV